MRIATMMSSTFSLPLPEGTIYAPIMLGIQLADELKKRGHEITFYAPPSPNFHHPVISGAIDSELHDHYVFNEVHGGGREHEKIYQLFDQHLLMQLYKDAQAGKYDIAHIHPIDRALPLADLAPIPTVYTLHDPIHGWRETIFKLYESPKQHLVTISDAQQKGGPTLHFARTIYNGVDTDFWKYSDSPRDRFVFVGRPLPDKGVKEAVCAARDAGERLDIITRRFKHNAYWDQEVVPLLTDTIRLTEMPRSEIPAAYGRAKALLFPIQWEEPFGLVMAEAMSCGTPVIAFNRGSVSEVVKDGVTGFIVNTVDEMVDAMHEVDKINPAACRKHVQDHFSLATMAEGYESLFQDIVKNQGG